MAKTFYELENQVKELEYQVKELNDINSKLKKRSKTKLKKTVNVNYPPTQSDAQGNELNSVLYAVLRLNTDIEAVNPFTGKEVSIRLGGVEGYIPVFKTMEEAKEAALNGKYQIIKMTT